MKRKLGSLLLLTALVFCGGCLVRSLQPWLSDETRADDPALLGVWHDAKENATLFFAEASSAGYAILLVNDGKETTRYTAYLHGIDNTRLLLVGPENPDNLLGSALLPGHLLFKAVLADDSLALYSLDCDSFAERAAVAPIGLLPGGSARDGFILTGSTAELETFVRAQLAGPAFFAEKPLYSLQRLPAP